MGGNFNNRKPIFKPHAKYLVTDATDDGLLAKLRQKVTSVLGQSHATRTECEVALPRRAAVFLVIFYFNSIQF